jgi:hypothetical protein
MKKVAAASRQSKGAGRVTAIRKAVAGAHVELDAIPGFIAQMMMASGQALFLAGRSVDREDLETIHDELSICAREIADALRIARAQIDGLAEASPTRGRPKRIALAA